MDEVKPTQQLHELGQSLWLDNITRTMLDDGTLAPLHRRALGHRADLEPDDLRQGDQRRRRLRRADHRAAPSRASSRRTSSSSWRWRTCAAPPTCSAPSTSAPTASTAGSRWRSRRCWPTTPGDDRAGRRAPRPGARDNVFIKIPGHGRRTARRSRSRSSPASRSTSRCSSRPSTTSPPPRRTCAASSAASRRPRPGRPLGGLAVHQPLGRRGRRRGARRAAQPPRDRRRAGTPIAPTASCSTPSAASASPTRAPGRSACSSRAPAPRTRRLRRPLHRGAGGAVHDQHDARQDAAGLRRPRRGRRSAPARRRATPTRCWPSSQAAGIDTDELAARLQHEGKESFNKCWNELLESIESRVPQSSRPQGEQGLDQSRAAPERSIAMQLGMIGLGRMGANMVRRLMRRGHECVVFDVDPGRRSSSWPGEGATGADSIEDFVGQADKPRAGLADGAGRGRRHDARRAGPAARRGRRRRSTAATPTTATTSARQRAGRARDRLRRRRHQRRRLGARARLLPDDRRRRRGGRDGSTRSSPRSRRASSPRRARPGATGEPTPAEQGYLHCGPSGAGHFVKMVHNGIEYGLMAAYAEGLNILQERERRQGRAGGRRRDHAAASIPSTTSTTSTSRTSPRCGGAAA